jgi:manganese/zinc/iron transport system permease protein
MMLPAPFCQTRLWAAILTACGVILAPLSALAAKGHDHGLDLPSLMDFLQVLTLQDYNTRVVIIGTTLLGLAAGLIGTFLLLRKRALLSDTLSHATLPGIALAFIIASALGGEGKNLLVLIFGAAVFALLGTGTVILIQRYSRLKDDAALGIVLSVYFGLGIALLGLATRMNTGNAAGLSAFIYGKTASMLLFDAQLIALTALAAAICSLLFFKEFTLISFDASYAAGQGWPVMRLDFIMMALAVVVTVVGLQAVGLILVVALLIIPPAAARFWTYRLKPMLVLSALFGALSCYLGATLSALMARLPAGAVIVLTASAIFCISLCFGSARGLTRIYIERRAMARKIGRENLLRSFYELAEKDLAGTRIPVERLRKQRAWSAAQLEGLIAMAHREGLLTRQPDGHLRLTERGIQTATRVVRNHRLWEAYLITHADIATSQVDWGADEIEHVLDGEIVRELERLLPEADQPEMPASPHRLRPGVEMERI